MREREDNKRSEEACVERDVEENGEVRKGTRERKGGKGQ